jgi:mannosyltransferase PIG-V
LIEPRSSTLAPRAPAPPFWVRALDVLGVAALLLGLFVLVFGGFTLHPGFRVRVHSPGRLLFVAAALVALRHILFPGEPLHRRLKRGFTVAREDALVPFGAAALGSRLAVLLVGYFAVITIGLAGKIPEMAPEPELNLPMRFDAGWYSTIAFEGYQFEGRFDKQQNVAFFPAFPMLMRGAGYLAGAFAPGVAKERRLARLTWGGTIVSLLAFVWAALYLWRFARDVIGVDRAADSVALLAAYPFAVFYSAPYTESLFLLGAVAAFYHFRRDEFGRAAAWGLLVGLTRPNGCFLSLALACAAVASAFPPSRKRFGGPAMWIAVAAPAIGMLLFSAYVHHLTGSWFGWARLHEAWGRSYAGLAPVTRAYGWITDEGLLHVVEGVPFDTLNSLGLIFALVMLWPVLRRLGVAYAVFVLVNVVPPMLAGGVLSMGRITSTIFPLFVALAAAAPRRSITPIVTAFAIAQGLAAALFFTWRALF